MTIGEEEIKNLKSATNLISKDENDIILKVEDL